MFIVLVIIRSTVNIQFRENSYFTVTLTRVGPDSTPEVDGYSYGTDEGFSPTTISPNTTRIFRAGDQVIETYDVTNVNAQALVAIFVEEG